MNENEKKICAICGEEHDVEGMTMTGNGNMVCQDCLDEHYFLCEYCDEYHPVDYAQDVHCYRGSREVTECWCPDCVNNFASECDDCGEMWNTCDCRTDDQGTTVCERCYDGSWCYCDDCGRLIRRDGANWNDDDEALCDSCWSRRGSDAIHQYSYKPEPIFASRAREDAAKALKFGIELEVDNGDDAYGTAKEVTEAAGGRIYCKRDGSLDCGFEIVTHPATLAYHLYDFRWANIMRICKQNGFKSHDTETCGLHIHVGRKELGTTDDERYATASKLVILASTLRDELTKFSRRKADRLDNWAAFTSLPCADTMYEAELLDYARREANRARYVAVNLWNASTVEFRIFRGTLKRDTLVASLQIVDNLCQYAMTHTAIECLNASFVDVVNVNPTSVLLDYCQSRRIVTRTAV